MRLGSLGLPLLGAILAVAIGCSRSEARPAKVEGDPEVDALRARGRALFFGRAGCHTCHRIGSEGEQIKGPNLGIGDGQDKPIAVRVRNEPADDAGSFRVREVGWGIEYIVESIVDPDAFTVPGYPRSVMTPFERPPISLTDDEIVALAAFLAGEGPGAPRIDREAVQRARARIVVARQARDAREAAP